MYLQQPLGSSKDELTDDETGEKSIDPSHNQRLRDHHGHLAFHHAHHALHSRRIAHWVWPGLAPHLRLSQKLALLIRLHHIRLSGGESSGREDIGVLAQCKAAGERSLLPDLGQVLLLGGRLKERHGIVAKDASENLSTH